MTQRRVPTWSGLAPLIRLKRPEPSPQRRRLANALTIEDLAAAARRRTPRSVFDYVDGAAETEASIRRARDTFERLEWQPTSCTTSRS